MLKENQVPQELALAIFLSREYAFCVEHISSFQSDWFDIALHKKVFEEISRQVRKGQDPNVMTITLALKQLGELSDGDPVRISKLTSDIPDWKISMMGVVDSVRDDYHRKAVLKSINNLNRNVSDFNFSKDKALNEVENVKKVLTNTQEKEKSNQEVVNDILNGHDKAKSGEVEGMGIGFVHVDENVVLEPDDMMIIGARPAMGKTAFAISILCSLVFGKGLKLVFFSLEMSKEKIIRRIVACLTGIDSKKIRKGNCTERELALINSLMQRPEWDNLTVYEGTHTVNAISDKLIRHKHIGGCDLFIVDYIQKIKCYKGRDIYEKATYNSNDLKEMIQDISIAGIALAQLKRDVKDRPKLADIRNTGDIEQDASIVGFLHRPEYFGVKTDEHGVTTEGVGEFIIAKNREDSLDTFKFNVDLPTSKWKPYELDKPIVSSKDKQSDMPF